jgi:hypothetical protein
MNASRGRRAVVLLLVVWLLADTSAFAFCGPQLVSESVAAQIGPGDGADTAQSTERQCFCCSQVVGVVRFDLHFSEERIPVAPIKQLRPPDISIPNSSPPPRF